MAVPEPQKNLRGELVVSQNSSHLHQLVQKKSTPGDQASLETGLDENDASIANIVRLLKFIPGKTFYEIGCKSLIMICSFKSEHVVQIAIILINSQACWDNRVCCNQYEHKLKCSEREIYQSHQHHNSLGTWTTDHFMQCGEFIARMDNSLKTFSHKAYESRSVIPKKNMR